jgi:hypothetical protein
MTAEWRSAILADVDVPVMVGRWFSLRRSAGLSGAHFAQAAFGKHPTSRVN